MSKNVSKKNLEKLKLYLAKNGTIVKPNSKPVKKPGTGTQTN